MKVLILAEHYLPGYKAGGPIRSLAAIVSSLQGQIDFSILTRSNDLGETSPLPGIVADEWHDRGGAQVYYSSRRLTTAGLLRRTIRQTAPDVLYLNSFFSRSTIASLLLLRCGVLPRLPVLLAPRGEFSAGALELKSAKKRAYLAVARRLGLFADVAWHVSSEAETADLRRSLPGVKNVHIAPDLLFSGGDRTEELEKQPGEASLVFIARISPKKNLVAAIKFLKSRTEMIKFDVYGPLEDRQYWATCLEEAARLPENINFSYRGELPHDKVAQTFARYHFFLFPTLGENFGHSIAEALQQGCPVLLSDQTPWQNLQGAGVGWDLSLGEPELWSQVLDTCMEMDNETYQQMSRRCRGFAESWVAQQGGAEANLQMFRSVASARKP